MINQMIFIMANDDPHISITRLLAYLEYRWDGVLWFPIPPGEVELWGSSGPETELGTVTRILRDWEYDSKDVARWLTTLADSYNLDTTIHPEAVRIYRRSL